MSYKFIEVESKEQGLSLLVSQFMAYLTERLEVVDTVNILMSGGNTPLAIYHLLLKDFSDFPWHQCRFVMLDERYVPFESERSNAGQCYRHFVQHVKLEGFIYPDTSCRWMTVCAA